jgi:hypothetical protein
MEDDMNIAPEPEDDEDEDDWIELEPPKQGAAALPEVSVRVAQPGPRPPRGVASKARIWSARVHIVFRREAAECVERYTRFRVQIGGQFANKIRLTPDDVGGRYETAILHGVSTLSLPPVNAWPSEGRPSTEASWEVVNGAIVLTLPNDWAKPRQARLPLPAADPAPPKPAPPPAFPITTDAPGLIGRRKA